MNHQEDSRKLWVVSGHEKIALRGGVITEDAALHLPADSLEAARQGLRMCIGSLGAQ